MYYPNYLPIEEIGIKIKDNRKWQVNNSRILTNTSQLIPPKFKKKFLATLTVKFENNPPANNETNGEIKLSNLDLRIESILISFEIGGHLNMSPENIFNGK